MTRRILIIAAAVALLAGQWPLRAGNPARREGSARLSCGFEWGYDPTLVDVYHYNYLDVIDGFRIDEAKTEPMYYSNGHASLHITLEFAGRWALGFNAGYAGIEQRTRFFPLALRSTYFLDAYNKDGKFIFLEGGAGFHETRQNVSPFGRAGYGYRLALTEKNSLDLSASLRMAWDHPPIYDSSIRDYVPEDNIRRSDALYGAICLSIAINF